MNKLFFICPDCCIEQFIRDEFGDNCFFLTALGTIFDLAEFDYLEAINQIIVTKNIRQIYLVNDISCTFIKNTVESRVNINTEKILFSLYKKLKDVSSYDQKCFKLAELNLKRLAYELTESGFIGNKISAKQISLKGLLFNHDSKKFITITFTK